MAQNISVPDIGDFEKFEVKKNDFSYKIKKEGYRIRRLWN